MTLKKIELLGACAAFIPFVSSVSSSIKAYYYVDRVVQKKNQLKLNQKVNDVANNKLDLREEKKECYEKLMHASFFEVIPFVNVIAAIYSAVILSKLSKLRDANQSDQSKQDYLCSKFDVQKIPYSQGFLQALQILDSFDPHDNGLFKNQTVTKYAIFKLKKLMAETMRNDSMQTNGDDDLLKNKIKDDIEFFRLQIKKIDKDIEFEEINYSTVDEYWEEYIYSVFWLVEESLSGNKM